MIGPQVVALISCLGPNVDQPFRYVTPGSVTAVLLLYCYVSRAVLLFGAKLNAAIHPVECLREEPADDVAGGDASS